MTFFACHSLLLKHFKVSLRCFSAPDADKHVKQQIRLVSHCGSRSTMVPPHRGHIMVDQKNRSCLVRFVALSAFELERIGTYYVNQR